MAPVVAMPESMTNLSDDQLRAALLVRGLNPGPIVTSTRHLYRKKLAQFMLREDQMEGFDTKVEAKADKFYDQEDEEEEDYQPSATVVVSPSVRSRTIRRAEVKEEEAQANTVVQELPLPRSSFSKICELLIFAFKFAIFLIILGAGFLFYTTITSSDQV